MDWEHFTNQPRGHAMPTTTHTPALTPSEYASHEWLSANLPGWEDIRANEDASAVTYALAWAALPKWDERRAELSDWLELESASNRTGGYVFAEIMTALATRAVMYFREYRVMRDAVATRALLWGPKAVWDPAERDAARARRDALKAVPWRWNGWDLDREGRDAAYAAALECVAMMFALDNGTLDPREVYNLP